MAVRKFAFVVFDRENKIIDRFNLDIAINPSGLGFSLNFDAIESDLENIITRVYQRKQPVTLTAVNGKHGYTFANTLTTWLQKYSTKEMKLALEYNDTTRTRYCEGKVVSFNKTELDVHKDIENLISFQPTTPFFTNVENLVQIEITDSGKFYPFSYPYSYGANLIENNNIENPYIMDVPLIIRIDGAIAEPTIQLIDEDETVYAKVKFTGITILEGQHLIINSADRKIYFYNGSEYIDYTNETDPQFDTFLRAQPGTTKLSINLSLTDTGKLTASWRQYGL